MGEENQTTAEVASQLQRNRFSLENIAWLGALKKGDIEGANSFARECGGNYPHIIYLEVPGFSEQNP